VPSSPSALPGPRSHPYKSRTQINRKNKKSNNFLDGLCRRSPTSDQPSLLARAEESLHSVNFRSRKTRPANDRPIVRVVRPFDPSQTGPEIIAIDGPDIFS
jgi:hypothetical protein